MKTLLLTKGMQTIVDDEDYELLKNFKWYYNGLYAVGKNKLTRKRIYLHRFLLKTPDGMFTDHVNGNRLDNRKSNLRLCSNRQNQQNRGKPLNNSSGHKGVVWHKKSAKWQAQIMVNSKQRYLGLFENLQEAKQAYLAVAEKEFAAFAKI